MVNTIGFPGLGLEFEINRVAFTVFGKDVYWYALCILTGYLLAILFVTRTCKKRGVDPDHIVDICIWGLIFGLVGARIYYCIFDTLVYNGICLANKIKSLAKLNLPLREGKSWI